MRLVISTATAACSVALIDGGRVIAEFHDVVGRGHAERLVPMIGALPGKGRADAILVDCGPGSFTGVRVGLAAARALALAWGVPLAGFSTLALIAAGLDDSDADDEIGVAIHGGHGELFVQRLSRHPLACLDEAVSLRPEAAAQRIATRLVIGSGAQELVSARGAGEARDAFPRAADARLLPPALAALAATPIYGRAPDAVAG
jgi:tRNA threonylcarbamoyl adenosine modification protein YeaZ